MSVHSILYFFFQCNTFILSLHSVITIFHSKSCRISFLIKLFQDISDSTLDACFCFNSMWSERKNKVKISILFYWNCGVVVGMVVYWREKVNIFDVRQYQFLFLLVQVDTDICNVWVLFEINFRSQCTTYIKFLNLWKSGRL